jgi:hypothetical protein
MFSIIWSPFFAGFIIKVLDGIGQGSDKELFILGSPMKKLIILSAFCLTGISAFALPDYDPFADATGSGGTSYTVGANLIGQKDAQGNSWVLAGSTSTTIQPTIAAGNLNISGLAASSGNSVAFGGNGNTARLALGSTTSAGTIYYSLAVQLTGIASLNTSGVFWAGFNNAAAASTSSPSVVGSKLYTRATAGGFNVGISKSSTSAADIAWDSADVLTTSSVIFLVGSYTFNTSTGSDDVAQLWVNPSSTSFGAGSAPTSTLTDSANTDLGANILSFVLADRSAAEPSAGAIDELRIGTSWADVTPPVPEPTTLVLGGLGAVSLGFFMRRRFGRK